MRDISHTIQDVADELATNPAGDIETCIELAVGAAERISRKIFLPGQIDPAWIVVLVRNQASSNPRQALAQIFYAPTLDQEEEKRRIDAVAAEINRSDGAPFRFLIHAFLSAVPPQDNPRPSSVFVEVYEYRHGKDQGLGALRYRTVVGPDRDEILGDTADEADPDDPDDQNKH